MICWNEAGVIERCLDSAAGAFDELCLVRAIGELPPDATMQLAEDWCARNGKGFKGAIYENKLPGLEQVDDFAAARNMSFGLAVRAGLAEEGWILWLDCDDTLDELNCRRIREAIRTVPANWDAIMCTYVLDGNGGEISRERLIRPGKGIWERGIHETCRIVSGDLGTGECPQIKVFHADHRPKHQRSAERNLAILDRILAPTPRQWFYLHAEAKLAGQREISAGAGRAALGLLEFEGAEAGRGLDERYQIYLNLSELEAGDRQPGDEADKTMEHLLEAVRLQPHRREAFAYLCQKSLNDGRWSDAVSYFRIMDALPAPSPLPWMHQGMWYEKKAEGGRPKSESGTTVPVRAGPAYHWGRNYLRVRVLRATGKLREACADDARYRREDPEYVERVDEHEADRRKGRTHRTPASQPALVPDSGMGDKSDGLAKGCPNKQEAAK